MKSLAHISFLSVTTAFSFFVAAYMGLATWLAFKNQNGVGAELFLFGTALAILAAVLVFIKKRHRATSIGALLIVSVLVFSSTLTGKVTRVFVGPQSPAQYIPPIEQTTTPNDVGTEPDINPAPEIEKTPPPLRPNTMHLSMAYINEAPDDNWTGSWKNACEEAAIAIVHNYYAGIETVSTEDAKAFMQIMFDYQQNKYGSDTNSDAARTVELIEQYGSFNAEIVTDPTMEAIKAEIDAGRPVIALHHGFDLGNKNIPFLATGSSYHATVIVGYNESARQFIVHDTGDRKEGANHLYDYDIYMNSLHDYTYGAELANGPARVLFTSAK